MTRTEVENMNTHLPLSPPRLQRCFLRMELPSHVVYCETDVFKPGRTYRIPFKFVVPEQLPIQTCQHHCSNHQIQQQHLQLPASLSHKSHGTNSFYDMSPEMAEVMYGINFELWQTRGKAGKAKKIMASIHPVHIIPIRDEHAPILVPTNNTNYRLYSALNVPKGMTRRKMGKLVACSAQPPAIQIHRLQPQDGEASTSLKINLRFEPSTEDELPPKFLSAQFQLRAMTFFGLEPWKDCPDLSDISTWGQQGFWSDSVSLLLNNEMKVEWIASQENGQEIFTALVEAQLSLSDDRSYPQTFHSCLVSRAYALKATLYYRVHGRNWGSSSISLSVPVEICAT